MAIRHGILRVGHIAIRAPFRGRRVEGQRAAFPEIDVALLHSLAGRPGGRFFPGVRTSAERERLCERELALILQPEGEPGRLDLLAEVRPGVTAELDRAERLAVAGPAAVVPRSHNQKIFVPAVLL